MPHKGLGARYYNARYFLCKIAAFVFLTFRVKILNVDLFYKDMNFEKIGSHSYVQ